MPNETNNPRDGLQHNQNNPGNPGGPPPSPSPQKPGKEDQDPKSGEQTGHQGGGRHQNGTIVLEFAMKSLTLAAMGLLMATAASRVESQMLKKQDHPPNRLISTGGRTRERSGSGNQSRKRPT